MSSESFSLLSLCALVVGGIKDNVLPVGDKNLASRGRILPAHAARLAEEEHARILP